MKYEFSHYPLISMLMESQLKFRNWSDKTLAPFTLPFQCGNHAIPYITVCVKVSDVERGAISLQHWSTSGGSIRDAAKESQFLCEWMRRRCGSGVCLSSCLSYQLFVTFLPETQPLSPATHPFLFVSFHYFVVVVTTLKKNLCDHQLSLLVSESQTASCLLM